MSQLENIVPRKRFFILLQKWWQYRAYGACGPAIDISRPCAIFSCKTMLLDCTSHDEFFGDKKCFKSEIAVIQCLLSMLLSSNLCLIVLLSNRLSKLCFQEIGLQNRAVNQSDRKFLFSSKRLQKIAFQNQIFCQALEI